MVPNQAPAPMTGVRSSSVRHRLMTGIIVLIPGLFGEKIESVMNSCGEKTVRMTAGLDRANLSCRYD
jgi:hypothetical protein